MMEQKYMVTATFQDFNLKNDNEYARFLVGNRQIFYCGDDEYMAKKRFDELPNKDKELFLAEVEHITINGQTIIKSWNKIKE